MTFSASIPNGWNGPIEVTVSPHGTIDLVVPAGAEGTGRVVATAHLSSEQAAEVADAIHAARKRVHDAARPDYSRAPDRDGWVCHPGHEGVHVNIRRGHDRVHFETNSTRYRWTLPMGQARRMAADLAKMSETTAERMLESVAAAAGVPEAEMEKVLRIPGDEFGAVTPPLFIPTCAAAAADVTGDELVRVGWPRSLYDVQPEPYPRCPQCGNPIEPAATTSLCLTCYTDRYSAIARVRTEVAEQDIFARTAAQMPRCASCGAVLSPSRVVALCDGCVAVRDGRIGE